MSGQEGGGWQSWGSPLTSTLLKLAGLGIAANRGALGAPLVYLGDTLSNARTAGLERAADKRFESILTPRERSVEIPGPMVGGEEPGTAMPPERRSYSSLPTQQEALQAIAQMPGLSDPVRQLLFKRVVSAHLGTEDTPPRDVERARLGGATERFLASEGVESNVRGAARDVVAAGGHPNVQVPPRLEPNERAFAAEVQQGKHGDPNTAEGLASIVNAARARGLNKQADEYIRQRGFVKDVREEGRTKEVRETLVPKWRQQAEALQARGVSDVSLAGLNAAIAAAEADPSPRNVAAVNGAFAGVGRQEQQAKQFTQKMAAYANRTQSIMSTRNETARANQARALLSEVTREIRDNTALANTDPDPVTRVHAAARVEELRELQTQLRDAVTATALGGAEDTGPTPPGAAPAGRRRFRMTPDGQLTPVPAGPQ